MKTLYSLLLIFLSTTLLNACSERLKTEDKSLHGNISNITSSKKIGQDFFKDLSGANYGQAAGKLTGDFSYYTHDPKTETEVFSSQKDFQAGAAEVFGFLKNPLQVLGYIGKYPWNLYVLGFSYKDEQYSRFCNLKILKDKISEMRCYIGSEESTKILGKKFPVENRNKLLAQYRQSEDDYNQHIQPNCNPTRKVDYYKHYPTYSKNIASGVEDQCAQLADYFKEADPSSLKLRTWHNPPWEASDITFASRYSRIDRIGLVRTYKNTVNEIHNFIPLKAFLFREYLVNIGVDGPIDAVYPPYVKTALGEWIARQQNETLLTISADGSPAGGVARRFSWNNDKTEITLTLDKFKRFSDGTYLEAGDVKASWEQALKLPKDQLSPRVLEFLNRVKGFERGESLPGVTVIDDSSLKIKFKKPFAEATSYLATVNLAPFKKLGSRYIGTGPYTVWDGLESTDRLRLWPNKFHPKKFTSLTFVNINSEDKELKKLDLHMKVIVTKAAPASGCSGSPDKWRCEVFETHHGFSHFPGYDENEPFRLQFEYNPEKIHPNLSDWKTDPFNFEVIFAQKNFILDQVTQEMIHFNATRNSEAF